MNTDWIVPGLAVFMVFGGGGYLKSILDSMNKTRVELAQLKAQQQVGGNAAPEVAALRQEVSALRQELHSLRDTSTQYDMSFDTALQRVEQRIGRIEQNQPQQQKVGY